MASETLWAARNSTGWLLGFCEHPEQWNSAAPGEVRWIEAGTQDVDRGPGRIRREGQSLPQHWFPDLKPGECRRVTLTLAAEEEDDGREDAGKDGPPDV